MLKKIPVVIFVLLLFALTIVAQDEAEPTVTPIPDYFQNRELIPIFQSLMQPNVNCELPCFWGFYPGTSTVSDVQEFWTAAFKTPIKTTHSEDGRILASFWTNFLREYGLADISITMTFKQNVLWLFKVSTFNPLMWLEDDWVSLQSALQQLSGDNNSFIRITVGSVSLVLINMESNILIHKTYQLHTLGNTISPDSSEPLLLCPTENNLISSELWLLDDETPISLEEILGNSIRFGRELAPYQPIELMTNLNDDEFSDFIREHPEECIELLSYSELMELGYGF